MAAVDTERNSREQNGRLSLLSKLTAGQKNKTHCNILTFLLGQIYMNINIGIFCLFYVGTTFDLGDFKTKEMKIS